MKGKKKGKDAIRVDVQIATSGEERKEGRVREVTR